MRYVKVVVVGDGGCGGTDLLLTYIRQEDTDILHTAHDHHSRTILVDGHPVTVELFDVTPQSDYDLLRPTSYAHTDAFIICYSTDNRTSFENISKKYVPEVRSYCPRCPYVIVGCRTSDSDSYSPKSSLQTSHSPKSSTQESDSPKSYPLKSDSLEPPPQTLGPFKPSPDKFDSPKSPKMKSDQPEFSPPTCDSLESSTQTSDSSQSSPQKSDFSKSSTQMLDCPKSSKEGVGPPKSPTPKSNLRKTHQKVSDCSKSSIQNIYSSKSSPQKTVGEAEGKAMSERLNAYAFYECSVGDPAEVNQIVARCVEAMSVPSKGGKQSNRCILL